MLDGERCIMFVHQDQDVKQHLKASKARALTSASIENGKETTANCLSYYNSQMIWKHDHLFWLESVLPKCHIEAVKCVKAMLSSVSSGSRENYCSRFSGSFPSASTKVNYESLPSVRLCLQFQGGRTVDLLKVDEDIWETVVVNDDQ